MQRVTRLQSPHNAASIAHPRPYASATVAPADAMQRVTRLQSPHNAASIAQPSAGSRKIAVVLVSIISVKSTPIAIDPAAGRRALLNRTATFNAASVSVVNSGSRIASLLKQ